MLFRRPFDDGFAHFIPGLVAITLPSLGLLGFDLLPIVTQSALSFPRHQSFLQQRRQSQRLEELLLGVEEVVVVVAEARTTLGVATLCLSQPADL